MMGKVKENREEKAARLWQSEEVESSLLVKQSFLMENLLDFCEKS